MFTVDSLATSLIMVLMYLIMLSVHYSAGDGRFSLLFGFTNLLTPTGYGHGYGTCPTSRSLSSSSEVERVKINESGLVGRMRRLGIMSSVYTILLLVTSISVLETELYHDTTLLQTLSPVISNKPLILSLVTVLGVLSIITTCLHYLSVLRHQQTKHADISPPTSPSSPMRPENRDVEAAGDNGVTEKRGLYPVLPSAPPDPPYNPYYQLPTPAGDTAPVPPPAPAPVPPPTPAPAPTPGLGNKICPNTTCVTCTKMIEGSKFSSSVTRRQYVVSGDLSCDSERLIYLVTCITCSKQYVGKTEQSLKQRHYGHRREVEQGSSALGQHFSSESGHCSGLDSLRIQIIELCPPGTQLLTREGFWQHELQTFTPAGINIRDELGGSGGKNKS